MKSSHNKLNSLKKELPDFMKNGVRINSIGAIENLPKKAQKVLTDVITETKNNNDIVLTFALSYGSREEIVNTIKNISKKVVNKQLNIEEINENTINNHLYTFNLPDIDLMIRTSGEQRISNFLLWQMAYAELYFTNILNGEVKIQQEICYLTYQSFPADTANSLQTISNIKYLVKNGVDVELIFPLREKNSNASVKKIKEYYSIKEDFHVTGVKHFLPFGRIPIFESFFFHTSHFLWSYFVVTFKIKKTDERQFITRSDWILYFLARKGYKVLFECHQTSKIRTFIINKSKKFQNVKFIFLNEHLQNYYNINADNSQVLHNGVDTEMFSSSVSKLDNKREGLIFVGNLRRFNESRGIDFIIDAFKASKFLQDHKLSIIGGPDQDAQKLRVKIKELDLQVSHMHQALKIKWLVLTLDRVVLRIF